VLQCVAVPYCVMDIYQHDAQVICYDSSVERERDARVSER